MNSVLRFFNFASYPLKTYFLVPWELQRAWIVFALPTQIPASPVSLFPFHPTLLLIFSPWRPACATQCSWMCGFLFKHGWLWGDTVLEKADPHPPPPAANNSNKTSPLWLVLYAQIPSPCRGLGWAYISPVHVVTATVSSRAQLPYWVSKTLLPCSHLPPLPLTFSLLPFLQWASWPFGERGTVCMVTFKDEYSVFSVPCLVVGLCVDHYLLKTVEWCVNLWVKVIRSWCNVHLAE